MSATNWRGKTALVTGASRGLGALIAERLAAEGLNLILVARDAAKLEGTRAACEAQGVRASVHSADITDPAVRAELVEAAGEVDVLVNNAGVEVTIGYGAQTEADVRSQIELNLVAPLELVRLMLPKLKARPRAAIVNVSSMSGKSPTPLNAVYAATKHGLNGFTSSLRIELAHTSVTAGVVCPSFVGGAGMWADTGVSAPPMMKEVPPSRVVAGVLQVMNGAGEILVTPSPVRPLLALSELFPDLNGPVLRWLGVIDALRKREARLLSDRAG